MQQAEAQEQSKRLQTACNCGNVPLDAELASAFLCIVKKPPEDLNDSNSWVSTADALQLLQDMSKQADALAKESTACNQHCTSCNAKLAVQAWKGHRHHSPQDNCLCVYCHTSSMLPVLWMEPDHVSEVQHFLEACAADPVRYISLAELTLLSRNQNCCC